MEKKEKPKEFIKKKKKFTILFTKVSNLSWWIRNETLFSFGLIKYEVTKDFIIVFEDNFVLINCEHGEILLFHVEKRMIFVTVDSLFYMNT